MVTNAASGEISRHAGLPDVLRRAVLAHEAGELDAAYPLYRAFVDENPSHPTALQLLGALHSQRGEFESAIALMRESLRIFPEQPEVHNNLGNALSKSGRLDDAIDSYAEALKLRPDYADALRNLALTFLDTEQTSDAARCFQRCLEVQPGDALAWLGLGNAHRRLGNLDAAIPCYRKALEFDPDYAEAHHNLGVCLRLRQRPDEALEHYEAARRLGLDRAELHHNLGNALADTGDMGRAIDAYRAAVARNPADVASHRNLNSLLWQQESPRDYLTSYERALEKHPGAVQVRLAYAMALNRKGEPERAEAVLRQGERHPAAGAELASLLAYTLEEQGRLDEALRLHHAAVDMPDAIGNHRISYARALLARRRPDEALRQAKLGSAAMPHNQRALAYLGLCWRMLDDERDAVLNDYQNLVRVYDVPVPSGYRNTVEFNERLAAVLDTLHVGRRHPPDQTLVGGTQTFGDLFLHRDAEIAELVRGIMECVQDYIDGLPHHLEHPMLSRRTGSYDFAASWSVRLHSCGYHTMHVHPLGWISSAYYVQVPGEIAGGDSHGGGLKFGEPDIDLGEKGQARRVIQPAVGRLVLFPSYMWHGTIPFESGESRLAVSFDVVPAG